MKYLFFKKETGSEPQSLRQKSKLIAFAVAMALVGGILCGGTWFLYRLFQTLPTLEQLSNMQPALATKVFGKDGTMVHSFSVERRFWVPISHIPKNLSDAVVAIEDRRFYDHWGIDVYRNFGAMFVNLVHHKSQGASTLTQQLARNVYLTSKKSMIRKMREALTAVQIEMYYTKSQIFELYLNQIYLGAGTYGVEAASQYYFNKPVSKLDLNECVTLAGTIQLPELYRADKKQNHKRIVNRREAVCDAMVQMRMIDKKQCEEIKETPIPGTGAKPRLLRAPYFVEMVRQYIEQKYGDDILYNGGLSIYTTLDPVAQDSIDAAVARHLPTLQRNLNRSFLINTKIDKEYKIPRDTFLFHFDSLYELYGERVNGTLPDSLKLRIVQTALVALDVSTGAILALVGGRNFEESKFNRATQANRQPGSAFKPFLFAAAVDSFGYAPSTEVEDQPVTIMTPEGEWRPENYHKEFHGKVTLRYALMQSINLTAISMINAIGAEAVVTYARRLGITGDMNAVPSLAIGACQVTPLEMTSSYAVFPAHGRKNNPYFIKKIVDKRGKILEETAPVSVQVLSPQTSFIMCDMMRSVVCCGTGAAIGALGFGRPAGGKTGTTNNFSDAWFVGFTPQVACGMWVGSDERKTLGREVTGAVAAIPVWVKAMGALHKNLPVENFAQPDSIAYMRICDESKKLATKYCPQVKNDFFISGHLPEVCAIHSPEAVRKGRSIDEPSKRIEIKKNKKSLMF